MSAYELTHEYLEAVNHVYLGWIIATIIVIVLGFVGLFISTHRTGRLSTLGFSVIIVGGIACAFVCFKPTMDGRAVAESAPEVIESDVQDRYEVADVKIQDPDYPSHWVRQLAQDEWEDRPHVFVLTDDGHTLEYEVGFEGKTLKMYPITDTQQVDPVTLEK